MHRRAVTCNMCGKAFFEASLKIHQPQCLKKQQMMHIPCSYCNCEFRRVEMPDHLKKCSAARKHRKQAAAAAARREEKQQRNVQHHQRSHSDGFNSGGAVAGNFGGNFGGGGGGGGDGGGYGNFGGGGGGGFDAGGSSSGGAFAEAPEAQFGGVGGDTFGRVPCRFCGRKFDGARIGKHQDVCSKLKHGPPKQVKARSGVGLGAAARGEVLPRGAGGGSGGGGVGRGANRHAGGAAPRRQQQHPRVGSSPQRGSPGQRRPQQQRLQQVSAGGGSGGGGGGGGGNDPKNKTNWRKQRAQLKEAMQAARQMTRFEKGYTDVMPEVKPSAPDPSLVACPHCGRTFSESAAERHMPICKNLIHTRPKPVTKSPTRNYTDTVRHRNANTASNFTGKTNLDNANKWGGTQTARASRGGHGGIAKGNHTSAHNPILGNR